MDFLTKNKPRKWVSVFVSCILTLLMAMHALVAPVLAAVSSEPLKLEYGDNITRIVLSYLVGDNWVEITEDNCSDLPANTNYQFEMGYTNISVDELLAADGKMVYKGLPDWFVPTGTGALLYGDKIVAMIEAVDGEILISFDKAWLEEQKANAVDTLSGFFRVSGVIDWRKLPPDGGNVTLPNLDIVLSFEGNLAQKYGRLEIEKSEPELLKGENGKYYLKYQLTVTSLEDISVPGVIVKDLFADADYISGYVGITKGLYVNGYEPTESSSDTGFTQGKWSMDGNYMLWEIGTLGPKEERTLTYYAEIAEDYVELVVNNPIQNRAEVYTKSDPNGDEYLKDTDANFFTPHNDVTLTKNATLVSVDSSGNGTVTYTITISAPDTNSFALNDLTLKDMFPDYLRDYLSGDSGDFLTVTVHTDGGIVQQKVRYTDTSFELTGLDLAPGAEITVTYTVRLTNIFFFNNGEVELTNTATVSKGNRTLRGTTNTELLEKHTMARKIVGDPLEENTIIDIPAGDSVYAYKGTQIVQDNTPPESFFIPKGSLQYQIVINEDGLWDLSSTSMKDKFDSDYLKYIGYVQIRLYERNGESSGDFTDSDMIAELESSVPAKTVWLKVDAKGEFLFKPEELGISGNYAYLLTYYAEKVNMQDVGTAMVVNSFDIEGAVGDGDGGYVDFPGIEVSVGKLVQGGIKYDAEKISWYYEPKPVYRTAGVGSTNYSESAFDGDYTNGAIYWVIRLDGNIGTGSVSGSGRDTVLSGFYIKDNPDGKSGFKRDSVVGVYIGSKDLDITGYESMEAFVSDSPWDRQLHGNPLNDQWFGDPNIKNPDYQWFASDTVLNGIIFPNGCKLKNNQAVYIVLRTIPTSSMPTGNNATKSFHNTLSIASGGANPVPVAEADYIYTAKTSLFKESKGAYIYNEKTDEFTNCSDHKVTDWFIADKVDRSKLTSGTYAAWLLNVNWNGSMEGTADVIDYLPPGMELVYVDVNNFGNAIKADVNLWPYTEYIEELSGSSDWTEMTSDCLVGGHTVKTVSYYNKSTGEIRWRVSNLTAGKKYNQHEINLRIICKVTDPEYFLNGGGKTYVNQAAILDSATLQPVDMESASVTLTREIGKYLDEEALNFLGGFVRDGKIHGTLNRLPFKLEINPLGEDMCEGSVLPTLIDEFSEFLVLVEGSIKVTAGGVDYTNFTYTVEEIDGRQTLLIEGLPDGLPITITYQARVQSVPNAPVTISNTAYWAGYTPPDKPQVGDATFEYQPSGEVFANSPPSIEIIKVDAASHSKRLSGATFDVYKVNTDGTFEQLIMTGVSDSMGKVVFGDPADPGLQYNTVYCIQETAAPHGYKLDSTPHYFVIVMPESSDDFSAYAIADDLDIWYESPEYSITIENDKGTIEAEKVFIDVFGNPFTPTSGSYRFGLFDLEGNLQEILTIKYTQNGPKYYLNNVPKDRAEFTRFDPESVYRVYELDELGNPITEGNTADLNGKTYRVRYTSDYVVVNDSVTITNYATFGGYLPSSGGRGIIGYSICGGILILLSLLIYWLTRRNDPNKQ